ncbi:MAG: DNRLRE domain-containing protein [Gaiellales bacterium]
MAPVVASSLDTTTPGPDTAVLGPEVPALVEVVERRTATTKTFVTDQPGQFLTKAFSGAVHFRDTAGMWQDIRTGLVEAGVGRVANAANDVRLELALNPADSVLGRVSVDDTHSVAFSLEGAQAGLGVNTGSTVTYDEALPQVDLRFISRRAGLKEELVLASGAAPDTFVFPMVLVGLTAEVDPATGDVMYRDETGAERLRTPHGFMTDANIDPRSGEAPRSDAVAYELIPYGAGLALRVRLDRGWLDDPARMWPVTVDPPYWNSTTLQDDTYVMSGFTRDNANDAELKVGTYDGGAHIGISFMHFDVSGLSGKVIESAAFHALNHHSWSCQDRGVGVYRVTQGWNGHTMTQYAGASVQDRVGWTPTSRGYEPGGCADGWASFGQDGVNNFMLDTVRNWTSQPPVWGMHGLALKVDPGSEGDNFAWKKFASWDACGGGSCIPHIDIYWSEPNQAPNVPDSRSPGSGWVGTTAPTLAARYTDPDGNDHDQRNLPRLDH